MLIKSRYSVKTVNKEEQTRDVIDLGAPRCPRMPRACPLPNARLYPGPQVQSKIKTCKDDKLSKRHTKVKPRRLAPNPRLYQAPPPRPIPPPTPPLHSQIVWAPPIKSTALDTASLAALRLAELRASAPHAASPVNPFGVTAKHTGDSKHRRTQKHKLRREPRSSQNPFRDQLDVLKPMAPRQWKMHENRATYAAI
ncbi:unnamed protein product [Parnassius apollo]|uniref:(apollo) hypothetical protein n=1 Tax=Parnassius apollo TaxID=110799 RepID=A0A8S3XAB8_PARAO|nr:unnamed protein product [Parnassius apollo]